MLVPIRSVAVALLFAAATLAQAPGQAAPALEFLGGLNDAPKSFAELEGKVVILDFARTW